MPLNPVRTADDQHSRIQHLQGAFHLRRKIHMSRRVHKGNRQVFPAKSRLLGKNGDSPFPFQLIIIQKGVPVVHPSRFPDAPAQIEERFRQGGFPCVNVGDHADAALPGRPLIFIFFTVFSRIFHENTSFLSKQRNPQRIRFPTLRRPSLFILPRMGECVKSFSNRSEKPGSAWRVWPVPDGDPSLILEPAAAVNKYVFTNRDIFTAVGIEGRKHAKGFIHLFSC